MRNVRVFTQYLFSVAVVVVVGVFSGGGIIGRVSSLSCSFLSVNYIPIMVRLIYLFRFSSKAITYIINPLAFLFVLLNFQ